MGLLGVGRARSARIIVAAHLAAAVSHGAAHAGRGAFPEQGFDLAVILLAVYAGPLAAAAALSTRRAAASMLLLVSMAAAFLYGAWNHFVAAGLDNVGAADGGPVGIAFRTTAVLLLILEAEGAAIGALLAKDAWATRASGAP